MKINPFLFTLLLLVYFGISFYTFLMTTYSISMLAELVMNPPPMLLNILISIVGALTRRKYVCPPKVFYSFIFTICVIHLACLAFNSANSSADSNDYAFYYETVLAGKPGVFGIESQFEPHVQLTIAFYLRLAYHGSILIFLIYLIKGSPKRRKRYFFGTIKTDKK